MKNFQFIHVVALVMGLHLVSLSPVWGMESEDPINKIVVIVDCSGSFKSQHQKAVEQTKQLLEKLCQTKLKRWEGESDMVNLISLDALPQVVWKGSIKALKASNIRDIAKLFSARKEFSSCTDVPGAFQLAFQNLEGDPHYVSKYLFVFSDLIHEGPTKSVSDCGRPVYVQGSDFPWQSFQDVSTTVFWMPANQQLIWKKAVASYGLEDRFIMYSSGFSENIPIVPPPRPKEKISEQERAVKQHEMKETLYSFGKWAGIILMVFLGAVVVLGLIAVIFRKRSPRPMSPRTGRIPPLNIAGPDVRRP